MARKVAGAVVVVLLLALLLSGSTDASKGLEFWVRKAKNPSCDTSILIDATCGKQCESEGYQGWICVPDCSCLFCPSLDLEQRPEAVEL